VTNTTLQEINSLAQPVKQITISMIPTKNVDCSQINVSSYLIISTISNVKHAQLAFIMIMAAILAAISTPIVTNMTQFKATYVLTALRTTHYMRGPIPGFVWQIF
jgi:hypothetical protein